jgi:TPP-dependent pyruvate/acetoin dehydrogenase alpha subunit
MLLIRTIEDRFGALFLEGKAPQIAASTGQEAAALGVIDTLGPDDLLLTNHRSMSHLLSRGADPGRVLAEILGKRTGYCQGKASHLHLSIRELGIMLTSTVVGAELSLAPGIALGASMQDSPGIVACFFGDGGACEGVFHESLNLAALWELPILYVCENNSWQAFVSAKEALPTARIADFAATYGIKSQSIDGTDLEAVREAAQAAVTYVRKERRPFLLESHCPRLRGHCVLDPMHYVDPEEQAAGWARDPIVALSRRLAQAGVLSDEARAQMQREVDLEVDRAFAFAMESPYPSPEELLTDVFA